MSQLSRRGFFVAWLVGLLSGCLGRSQAKAAAPDLNSAPNSSGSVTKDACQSIPASDGPRTSSAVLPPGLSINPYHGLISGTIDLGGCHPTPPLP